MRLASFILKLLSSPKVANKSTIAYQRESRLLFLLKCKIHGSHYYSCLKMVESNCLHKNQILVLQREPNNPHDEMAIEIFTECGEKLGYIPKQENKVIANIIDQQKHVYAHIIAIEPSAWNPVTIDVYLSDKK